MFTLPTLAEAIAYLCLAGLTVWATVSDLKTRKIPNGLTVAGFALGLVWQGYFHGTAGILTALGGFAIGFGTFFVLWLTGGGGGGDVKLMGALGAWLGFQPTLYVLFLSTVLVLVLTVGTKMLNRKQAADTATKDAAQPTGVALALPVSLAVWGLLLLDRLLTTRDIYPM